VGGERPPKGESRRCSPEGGAAATKVDVGGGERYEDGEGVAVLVPATSTCRRADVGQG
jgi:hypothetical protein